MSLVESQALKRADKTFGKHNIKYRLQYLLKLNDKFFGAVSGRVILIICKDKLIDSLAANIKKITEIAVVGINKIALKAKPLRANFKKIAHAILPNNIPLAAIIKGMNVTPVTLEPKTNVRHRKIRFTIISYLKTDRKSFAFLGFKYALHKISDILKNLSLISNKAVLKLKPIININVRVNKHQLLLKKNNTEFNCFKFNTFPFCILQSPFLKKLSTK